MHGRPAPFKVPFNGREPLRELVARAPQRRLGLEVELARQVGDGKEQVSEFFGGPRRTLRERFAQFPDLFLNLGHRARGVRPIESHCRDTRADFIGTQQRGQCSGHS